MTMPEQTSSNGVVLVFAIFLVYLVFERLFRLRFLLQPDEQFGGVDLSQRGEVGFGKFTALQ